MHTISTRNLLLGNWLGTKDGTFDGASVGIGVGAGVGTSVGDLVGLVEGSNAGATLGRPVGGRIGDFVGLAEKLATGDFVGVSVPGLVGNKVGGTTDTGANVLAGLVVEGAIGPATGAVLVGTLATDDGASVGAEIAGDLDDGVATGVFVFVATGDPVTGKLTGRAGEFVVPDAGSFEGAETGVGTTFGDAGIRTGKPVGAIVELGLEGAVGLGDA